MQYPCVKNRGKQYATNIYYSAALVPIPNPLLRPLFYSLDKEASNIFPRITIVRLFFQRHINQNIVSEYLQLKIVDQLPILKYFNVFSW
jgi:hypothetical protein